MDEDKFKILQEKIKPEELVEFAWRNMELFEKSQERLKEKILVDPSEIDLRLWIFELIKSSFQNCLYTFIFVKDSLTNLDWWNSNKYFRSDSINNDLKIDVIAVYITEVKINLIFNIFKHLEVFLRDLCRHFSLFKSVEKVKFYQIRDEVIKVSNLPEYYTELIKLYQKVRNSYHNNGFYFEQDEVIHYKGTDYEFIFGKPVDFLNLNFLDFLFSEINEFLLGLVESSKISEPKSIKGLIHKVNFIKEK